MSRSSIGIGACYGDECKSGGSLHCLINGRGKLCTPTAALPCVRCVERPVCPPPFPFEPEICARDEDCNPDAGSCVEYSPGTYLICTPDRECDTQENRCVGLGKPKRCDPCVCSLCRRAEEEPAECERDSDCNPNAGRCVHYGSGDDRMCTGDKVCAEGKCVGLGKPIECRACSCAPSSGSSANSSAWSSANSSGMSVGTCRGDECVVDTNSDGWGDGDAFCAETGRTCRTISKLPCIKCVQVQSSSSSLSSKSSSSKSSSSSSSSSSKSSFMSSSRSSFSSSLSRSSSSRSSVPSTACGDGLPDPGEQCGEPGLTCSNGKSCNLTTCRCTAIPGTCGNGIVEQGEDCDAGSACADDAGSCNRPPLTIGALCACSPGSVDCVPPEGVTSYSSCQWPRCGDGLTNNTLLWNDISVNFDGLHEECDDGNDVSGDGCSDHCAVEATVPALITEDIGTPGEPPFTPNYLSVPSRILRACGNGTRDPGETCGESGLSCPSGKTCNRSICRCITLPASCGNGTMDPGEECNEPGLSCSSPSARCNKQLCRCTETASSLCGNGIPDPGEQCGESGLTCPAGQRCELSACLCSGGGACGNNQADPGEQCHEPGLRCSPPLRCSERTCLCMPPPGPSLALGTFCGNGKLEQGEECDDGNLRDFDGCSGVCLLEAGACGDGILQRALGETCEPGLHDPSLPYSCNRFCQIESRFCGDSALQPGEQCDDGTRNSLIPNARCRPDCSFGRCGDYTLDSPSEACDDGNRLNGDGCDRFCRFETAAPTEETLPGQIIELPFVTLTPPEESTVTLPPPPRIPVHGTPVPETGPAAIAVIAAGAAAGYAWVRRKRK